MGYYTNKNINETSTYRVHISIIIFSVKYFTNLKTGLLLHISNVGQGKSEAGWNEQMVGIIRILDTEEFYLSLSINSL